MTTATTHHRPSHRPATYVAAGAAVAAIAAGSVALSLSQRSGHAGSPGSLTPTPVGVTQTHKNPPPSGGRVMLDE
jgi:hypothetical protein